MSTEIMTKDEQFIIIPRRGWGATVPSSEPKSFVEIMNEQRKEQLEDEEFDNYIKENYVFMSNDFMNLESEQDYSMLLKSCLDQELNLHVLELDDEEEMTDEEGEDAPDYTDESALIESCYFSKLNEHLGGTKHTHSHATKCQDKDTTKQQKKNNTRGVRDRTKSQSQSDIDSDTRMTLYKFMKKSVLKDNYGVVNKGKKSLILHAQGGVKKSEKGDSVHLPHECAIKVFKPLAFTEAEDGSDARPASASVWAHREFQNLKRMEKAGIPSPKAAFAKQCILVMQFIGKDGKAAWKLRDYPFENHNALKLAYGQVIQNIKTMYKSCHLVHSDLSEKSILLWNNDCYFTDVAHALEASNSNSHAFLYRNCRNIVNFFRRKGLEELPAPNALFEEITGFEYPGFAAQNN